MSVKEVQISIDGLREGMFVSRLDKPWRETPFLLEGMKIQGVEEIEQLRKHCTYVFVDVDLGHTPDPRYSIMPPKAPKQKTEVSNTTSTEAEKREFSKLRKRSYETTKELKEELKTATKTYDEVRITVQQVMQAIKTGHTLDFKSMQKGISAMVGSIERNPSAFALVIQLRKTDDHSYNRALGTSVWCATFGRHLGLESRDIDILALGGMLLDIGKIKLPPELNTKTQHLTQEEYKLVKTHVDHGVRIVTKIKHLRHEVVRMVATHHERADGSGYPVGLDNTKIPLFGRIAGIVDTYDAMTNLHSFRGKALTPHEAIGKLYQCRGKTFQAELVEQFIQTVGLFPTGSLVELNTGEVGVVVAINGLKRLRPTVMTVLDQNKVPYEDFNTIDLTKVEGIGVKHELPPGAFGINMSDLFL